MKIGIIGCGNISGIYIQNLIKFKNTELVALADRDMERAVAKAKEIEGASGLKVCSVAELLADKKIKLVVNLTVPKAHTEVALACLKAGKHTYSEKPFALSRGDGKKILAEAKKRGPSVGCAPDTFLGAGIQTCREIIDGGTIGDVIATTAFMTCHGHESWHPDPEFYYETGGGPMFDMGPYYLTALVNLVGGVKRATGFARASFPTRTITSEKKKGKIIRVETPTHLASSLEFVNGALGTMIMSFDVWGTNLPRLEIYGTKGSLSVPDPNTFGGEVKVKIGREPWSVVEVKRPYAENSRGLGVAEMVEAIAKRRTSRASGDLASHVVEVMEACVSGSGKVVKINSRVNRPAALSPTTAY